MTAVAQFSFAGGELAPAVRARVDAAKYAIGAGTLRNFFVAKHGGAYNRAGTRFIAEVKDSTKETALRRFVFNDDNAYALEFGEEYIRFYQAGAQIEVSGVAAWSGVTAYEVGDLASRLGVNYYCILAHTNQQPPNATYWYPLTGDIYEIPTPYQEEDLFTLQFAQSGDVVPIAHTGYAPRELSRFGHTDWTLAAISFAPSIATPANLAVSGAAGTVAYWVVTAIAEETLEESLVSSEVGANSDASSGSPRTLTWDQVTGAQEYRVYKRVNGTTFGFIGTALQTGSPTFIDTGVEPDTTSGPPIDRTVFGATGDYPAAVGYPQQRLAFAGSTNDPEKFWASRTGDFHNFTIRSPLQDDDAVTFTLAGSEVNKIQHILVLNKRLILLTSGGEWLVSGNEAGILLPTAINASQESYNGASTLPPIKIGATALYVEAGGNVVRDIAFNLEADGYAGNDLTIFSAHLLEGRTIVDWAYAKRPHSIVWMVRDDGVLLGLTYIREHQMVAWHRHDFENGAVESVCAVPEGGEDALYLVMRRVIDGATVRYVERMESRFVDPDAVEDLVFMDSALTYDGRNTNDSHTMTLSGGTTWEYTETLTLTSSASYFTAGDVGNAIHLTGADGTVIRCMITAYTNGTTVSVKPHKTVPVAMRAAAISVWARAVDEVTGLDHLEGEDVAVFADGHVLGSPLNASYTPYTVEAGAITLDRPYAVITVGLPITADLETLDIDTAQGEPLATKKKIITNVACRVEKSRGGWFGAKNPDDDPLNTDESALFGLTELKQREAETMEEPVALATDTIDVMIESQWSKGGRVFIRQVEPLPLAILSVQPSGLVAVGGGS